MVKFKPSIRFERQVILKKLPSFACKSVSRVSPHCFTNPNFCLQSTWQRLVRRMTRFFTTVSADASLTALKDACECLTLGYKLACNKQVPLCLGLTVVWQLEVVECLKTPRLASLPQVTVSTLDRRNNKLIFKVHLLEMDQKVLLDFRLSKVSFSVL